LLFLTLALVAFACAQKPAAPAPSSAPAARTVPVTPSEIELSDAKATLLEPMLVEFEVKYRFTQGQPQQYYACEFTFPGTANHGVRKMNHWELKSAGVIRDRITLSTADAKSFAIHMTEAPSPRAAYKKISNVVTGPIDNP